MLSDAVCQSVSLYVCLSVSTLLSPFVCLCAAAVITLLSLQQMTLLIQVHKQPKGLSMQMKKRSSFYFAVYVAEFVCMHVFSTPICNKLNHLVEN